MHVALSAEGAFLSLVCEAAGVDRRRPLQAGPAADLARRYALAWERPDPAALLALGRELHAWLDGAEGWLAELRPKLVPPFVLEVRAPLQPDAAAWAVLHAPWELLADQEGFLAADPLLRYAPARRLGPPGALPKPDGHRLGVAFMAAAPRGAVELDHEAEEAAILEAAGQDLDLFVEDSGEAEELGRRLAELDPGAPLPVLHLSCHGHDAWPGPDGQRRPVLLLEDATGEEQPTPAGALVEALGAYRPRLLFLSACLTAAAGGRGGGAAEAVSGSLATALVRAGLPAVLGWDGSVADAAATAFARALYDGLGRRMPLAEAAATARRALLNSGGAAGGGGGAERKDAEGGMRLDQRLAAEAAVLRRDWHLARVWLGAEGGGAVVGGTRKRSLLPAGHGAKQLLAAKREATLEVAGPAMFVGRRRELQAALRALAGQDRAGLLLHGMGRLGKSSLAARIADRRRDLRLAVVYRDYDALSVVDALAEALRDHPPARELLAARRPEVRARDAEGLEAVLVDLLAGPCQQAEGGRPVLLLLDDLERILEADPQGGRHRVRPAERGMLAALLRAFDPGRSDSRLLVTSRFPFALVENGRDLAARLAALELGEFGTTARRKLALRQVKAAQLREGAALDGQALAARLPLLARAEAVARGNPGLQDLLGDDVVLRPAVPAARAEAVLDEAAVYLAGGDLPQVEQVREFLQNLALDELLALAGPAGQALLRAATLFRVPVPERVIAAVAKEVGGHPERLRDLGLLAPAEDLVEPRRAALAASGLAAGRLAPLAEAEQATLTGLALPVLFAAWGGAEGGLARPYAAELELARLALLAGDAGVAEACAAAAVHGLAQDHRPREAAGLGQRAVALLEAAGRTPPLRLLANTASALSTIGEGAAASAALAKGADRIQGAEAAEVDPGQLGGFLFALGDRPTTAGDLDGALASFERLCGVEAARDNPHQLAAARGRIADILHARGELDAALRIRREEELPVYSRLGEVREMAVTHRKIADILQARGEPDAALRLHREEVLPVFARLRDVRSVAVTQGKIADILARQGDLDGALELQAERLEANRKLRDAEGIAAAQWDIAQIELQREPQHEQAMPRLAEAWALFNKLGRVDSIAMVGHTFGQLLAAAGPTDRAREILRGSAEAFRKLGRGTEADQVEGLIRNISTDS